MKSEDIKNILSRAKTIAIVGAKDDEGTDVDSVGRYLIAEGYNVIPVHPKRETVWGLKAYKNLADIPDEVDLVDVFRAAEFCEVHAKEAAGMSHRPKTLWLQLGITNDTAMHIAEENGMFAIQDCCIKVQHKKLFK